MPVVDTPLQDFAYVLDASPNGNPEGIDRITGLLWVDGQLLINGDMLGYFEAFTPKFVKKYANLAEVITGALQEYVDDVHQGRFPSPEHSYSVLKDEVAAFNKVVERYRGSRKKS